MESELGDNLCDSSPGGYVYDRRLVWLIHRQTAGRHMARIYPELRLPIRPPHNGPKQEWIFGYSSSYKVYGNMKC